MESLRSFESWFLFLAERVKVLAVLNLLFFGCAFGVTLLASFLFLPQLYSGWHPVFPDIVQGNWLLVVLFIFASNLVLSAFVFVTLPGIALFPLSPSALGFRAVLWGLLIYGVPTRTFLIVIPTLVLEGEAYVLAALAGAIVGVSWVKPRWIWAGEDLSRGNAFKKALKECLRLYVFVAVLLFAAAVVETVTVLFIQP
jgi:hypothetical protein